MMPALRGRSWLLQMGWMEWPGSSGLLARFLRWNSIQIIIQLLSICSFVPASSWLILSLLVQNPLRIMFFSVINAWKFDTIQLQGMAMQLPRNLSHRRLIKEKTNQIYEYSKPSVKAPLSIQCLPLGSTSENKSSCLVNDDPSNTSFDRRLQMEQKQSAPSLNVKGKSAYFLRRKNNSQNKPREPNFKSVEAKPQSRRPSPCLKNSFSIKKYNRSVLQNHATSMETIQLQGSKKREPADFHKPKSENLLRQTLKKTSSKLKLKVKDPFEKRVKLENEFHNESVIEKNQDEGSILLSTINQEEFKNLLSQII